jgi:hypothetical protein
MMIAPRPASVPVTSSIPMTSAALRALEAELAELTGPTHEDGVIHLPRRDRAERVEVLRDVLARAVVVHEHAAACVGRRVRVREEDGEVSTHALVIPGDGDAFHAWLSIEAPMGAALVGARAGDRVQVVAPAGARWLEVLEVR